MALEVGEENFKMTESLQLDPDILEGRADEVPPLSSKIIRVFLSSTFSGM